MSEQDQKYSYIIGSAQNIEAYLKAQDETATEQKIELSLGPLELIRHKRQLKPFLTKYGLENNREGILLFLNKKSFDLNRKMLNKLRKRLIDDARSRGQDLSDLPRVFSQVSEDNSNYEALQLYLNKLLELKNLKATPKKDLGKVAVNFDDLEDHGKSLSLKEEIDKKLTKFFKAPTNKFPNNKIEKILDLFDERVQLSLKIILDTGINARQLITLYKSEDSTYKKQGKTVMERQLEHLLYAGKGQGVLYEYLNDYGEAVEIYLDPKLADNLERFKLAKPCEVVSNGVKYLQFYDLVAGAKLRSIFKEGVYNHINFNYSLNILRNLYREKRLKQLQELGFTPLESYFIVNFEFNRQALRAFEVPRAQSKQVSVQKTVIQEKADALDEDQEELSDKNVKEEESSAFESKFTLKSSDLKQKSVLYDENSNSGLLLKFLRLNTK